MPKLTLACPDCNKPQILHCEYAVLRDFDRILRTFKTFTCGHTQIIDRNVAQEKQDFGSLNGKKLAYAYQQTGIAQMVRTLLSSGGVLNADSMGLGKTIQALLSIRANEKEFLPCLTVVKSATTFQWIREQHEWLDDSQLSCFPILGSQGLIPPGFKNYIISMDTLGRNGTWKKLLKLGLKLVIVDECHSFKDQGAARTKALLNLIREGNIRYKILLSGTPIKNRASEYFTALNILAPDYFPSETSFRRRWLAPETSPSGVVSYKRLNPYRIDQFKDLISKWVLRREKQEVLLDLPEFTRNFQFVQIEDQDIKNSYNKQLDLFQQLLDRGGANTVSILGELAKLRRLTGMSKVPMCAEYVNEFLDSTEDFKLAIGIQHKDVLSGLKFMLDRWSPLTLSGADSAWQKEEIVQKFKRTDKRLLILNELAGGVGLNLQMCANTLVLERQWNAADEEQFESRFHRNGQTLPVIADYLVASGTIDEWFHNMVEEKRKIFGETISAWDFTSDETSIRDLAEQTLRNRL